MLGFSNNTNCKWCNKLYLESGNRLERNIGFKCYGKSGNNNNLYNYRCLRPMSRRPKNVASSRPMKGNSKLSQLRQPCATVSALKA